MLAAATASCRAMLMPMPPTGDMAWAASPMQSRPGDGPAFEVVDLDGEELDLVPGIEFGGAAGEEGGEALDAVRGRRGGRPAGFRGRCLCAMM